MGEKEGIRIAWLFRKLRAHPLLDPLVQELETGQEGTSVGWGYRPSGSAAIADAARRNAPLLLMEDAFVRSLKPGAKCVYGVVADSEGTYYDASGKSDLLNALETGSPCGWMRKQSASPDEVSALIARFTASRTSKYNWYPGDFSGGKVPEERGVLVIDQTRGDLSLEHAGVAAGEFDRMIRDALDEHPDKPIYLRAHPDHRYRGKTTCFSPWVFSEERITILPPDLSPATCFGFCDEVYVASSLMGMEALLHGCVVKTYGWNFYAGRGLTEDRGRGRVQSRERAINLHQLFEAAYLQYSHYFDPDSGEPCGLGRILDHLELQREIAKQNAGLRVTVGWTPWQRSLAEEFFRSPGCTVSHVPEIEEVSRQKNYLLWGGADAPRTTDSSVTRVEDGFLRSAGLGADFHKPMSWVIDDLGIYFDPTQPSRLETILEAGDFSPTDIDDSRELVNFLKSHRLSKYNLADSPITWRKSMAAGKKVILVPGQVEADASIRKGSPQVKTNAELLKRVRAEEPDAFLIFKSHPDLVAAARHGNPIPAGAEGIADLIVTDGNVIDWLDLCDEVHTMTSTVGFEAILRNIPVRTHGLPFYAGWGLSSDLLHCARRTRKLSVDELACGALILYPRYLNPISSEFTSGIHIARLLARGDFHREHPPWHMRIVSILKHTWVRLARR